MSDFSKTFSVDEGISFGDDVVGIVFGAGNPSTIGEIAPTGTLFLRTDGTLYQKTAGSPDTAWVLIASQAAAADNDLMYRSGGDWIGTAGLLTWDGSTFKATGTIEVANSRGGAILNETSSVTNPTLIPDKSLPNTGIGRGDSQAGTENLALIAQGVTAVNYRGHNFAQVVATHDMQTGITASTTQTQLGGAGIISSYAEVSTVANVNDSCLVAYVAAAGRKLLVINNGANAMQLFPTLFGNLGAGVDAAIIIAAGSFASFIAYDAINFYQVAPAVGSGTSAVLGHSGATSIVSKGSTDYIGLGSGGVQGTEANAEFYVPFAGTIKNLRTYVSGNGSNNAGNNITVRKNGGATSLAVTYGAAETGLKSDMSSTVSVNAGDRIAIEVVNTGTGGQKNIDLETVTLELA